MREEYANKAMAEKLASMPTQGMMAGAAVGRQGCRTYILEHVERMRREAHQLEALAMQIDHLSPEAEQILYTLLSGMRR